MRSPVFLFAVFLALSPKTQGQTNEVKSWSKEVVSETSQSLRGDGKTYFKKIEYSYVVPSAADTAEQLTRLNPDLPKVLNDFGEIIESAKVSPYYDLLYKNKMAYLEGGSFPSTHNYFDCETVLECEHKGTKILFLQADMDVVTDGTDPLRAPLLSDYDEARVSNSFLPFTKHGWTNTRDTPKNPFQSYYPELIKDLEEIREQILENQKDDKGIAWRKMLSAVDEQLRYAKGRGPGSNFHEWTGARRYPLAEQDPFVVLPNGWFSGKSAWKPRPGNLAAVIYKNKIYPAILGDSGPENKVGEASIRLAKELNSKASGQYRAVSDLTVSYLVFPGTSSSSMSPDKEGGHLKLWRAEVLKLLESVGGISSPETLHEW